MQTEQSVTGLTSPSQRTAPKSAQCRLKLGDCPHQLSAEPFLASGVARDPNAVIACRKRGMTKHFSAPGYRESWTACLYAILSFT